MAQLTGSWIVNALKGLFSALDATDQDVVQKNLAEKKVMIACHDSATAGTAFTKSLLWYNDTGLTHRVTVARATAPIAVTANATSYASFIISRVDAAGANATAVATFATDTVTTDDMVAHVPKEMALSSTVEVPAGYALVAEVSKASSGVAVTAATSRAIIEARLLPV